MIDVNLRGIALDCLMEILEKGSYSNQVLQQVLSNYQYLEKQQRSFLSRLVQGTVERLLTLDYVIGCHSRTPVAKMKPVVRTVLRSSVYQLLYMDAVPDAAVCNEAVKLVKKRGLSGLGGFVNGVLRAIARKKDDIRYPDWETAYAMPQWLIDRWVATYEKREVERMLASYLMDAAVCIRVNQERTTPKELAALLEAQGVTVTCSGRLPYAMYLEDYDHLSHLPSFREGLFYVQDISSMLATEAAGIVPGQHVIDVCAAPGGKALHAAELLHGEGLVEARDVSGAKVDRIRENIKKSGLNNIRAEVMDARVLHPPSVGAADVVIADLPCSGLGVIGKKPDIKYHVSPERILQLAALQREILGVVQAYVKEGGVLLYATCTVSKEENQGNVAWFLREYPDFVCAEMQQILPKEGRQDGFFWARLCRKGVGNGQD